jgi:hypothetical protein
MKRVILIIAAISALVFQQARADPGDGKIFRSSDGQYQLTLTKGWESTDFHLDTVVIGAINKHAGEYVEVVAEDVQNYTDSLDQYAEAKRDTMALSMDNPRMTGGEPLEVNGVKAMRFEIHGTLPNSNVTVGYVLTVMKTKTHYIQVIGWTQETHFADNRKDLENLVAGFSENADAQK